MFMYFQVFRTELIQRVRISTREFFKQWARPPREAMRQAVLCESSQPRLCAPQRSAEHHSAACCGQKTPKATGKRRLSKVCVTDVFCLLQSYLKIKWWGWDCNELSRNGSICWIKCRLKPNWGQYWLKSFCMVEPKSQHGIRISALVVT